MSSVSVWVVDVIEIKTRRVGGFTARFGENDEREQGTDGDNRATIERSSSD